MSDDVQRILDFLETIDIRDVINAPEEMLIKTPLPCPICGESEILLDGPNSYQCIGCDHWGTTAQYLNEREGIPVEKTVDEIARRLDRPSPLENFYE